MANKKTSVAQTLANKRYKLRVRARSEGKPHDYYVERAGLSRPVKGLAARKTLEQEKPIVGPSDEERPNIIIEKQEGEVYVPGNQPVTTSEPVKSAPNQTFDTGSAQVTPDAKVAAAKASVHGIHAILSLVVKSLTKEKIVISDDERKSLDTAGDMVVEYYAARGELPDINPLYIYAATLGGVSLTKYFAYSNAKKREDLENKRAAQSVAEVTHERTTEGTIILPTQTGSNDSNAPARHTPHLG